MEPKEKAAQEERQVHPDRMVLMDSLATPDKMEGMVIQAMMVHLDKVALQG